MGSTQSTSDENYNNSSNNNARSVVNRVENSDPWWPIENNESFTLEQPNRNENIIIKNSDNNNGNNQLNPLNKQEILNEYKSVNEIDINIEKIDSNSIVNKNSEEKNSEENNSEIINSEIKIVKSDKEQTLEEFKEELKIKRMARQTAISDLREEISRLRCQLTDERELNRKLRNGEYVCLTTTNDVSCSTDDFEDLNGHAIVIENNQFEASLKEMVKQLQKDLAETHYSLQMTNSENITLNSEVSVLRKQVNSLKDVVICSKQMIEVREEQVMQLKAKLIEIEESLADRETQLLSEDLKREYDKQMENIRNLRQLYEERARVCAAERENLLRQIQIKKDELVAETDKTKNLEERVVNLDQNYQQSQKTIEEKISECSALKYENRELKEEMSAINMLFSQMLMGFNGNDCLDIDRLTVMLEENRTLLNEMAIKETNYEGASLPKLLFDIVKQANNNENDDENDGDCMSTSKISSLLLDNKESTLSTNEKSDCKENTLITSVTTIESANIKHDEKSIKKSLSESLKPIETTEATTVMNSLISTELAASNNDIEKLNLNGNTDGAEVVVSTQEIIGNLPKVWRVIMELLNHQKIEKVDFIENGQSEDCYKSIQNGATASKPELSVSKTYIKLKNLILEKKSLVKETNRLKTLNSHLENRLNEQEKRLSAVSLELQKTWHLVGKMQRQHRQLHTHEQILRYQLQQKRRLLNELKEELEYCRRKWAAARAKNMESQLQCDDMRKEFAKRRLEDSNNSAESGYSDGAGSGSDEDEKNLDSEQTKKIPPHKFVHDFIENARMLERRNSLTPSRVLLGSNLTRCQSAPAVDTPVLFLDEQMADGDNMDIANVASGSSGADSKGAVPKPTTSGSQSNETDTPENAERSDRIHRLEEQCKSLIARVIETSGCREKLEVQIKRFKDELPPAQHPVPLNEYIERKSKSPSPSGSQTPKESNTKGQLTEREEEYTRRRSERIQRLENESKQLMSRIRRTNDRGSKMVTKLKELHARCINSREGSVDSSGNEEEEQRVPPLETIQPIVIEKQAETCSNQTDAEKEELSKLNRCAERLRKLEEEGQKLLSKWTKNSERGTEIENKLDGIHAKHMDRIDMYNVKSEEGASSASPTTALSRSDSQKTVEERLKEVENKANSRDERLRQMEIDSKELITKLTKNSDRGSSMIDRLKESGERRNSLRREFEKVKKEKQIASAEEEAKLNIENEPKETIFRTMKLTGAKPKEKELPKSGVGALVLSAQTHQTKAKKSTTRERNDSSGSSSNNSESLEEMFMRLSGLATPGNQSTDPNSPNGDESDKTDNSNDSQTSEDNK